MRRVNSDIRWVKPKPEIQNLSIQNVCDRLGVKLIVTNNRPEWNETGGSPSGAILDGWGHGITTLFVGHDSNGGMNLAHQYGALHELTHVVTAPYGFDSEIACGFYAVQYALASMLENAKHLCKNTKDMQGLDNPVFGGVLQARAWALGLLDDDRNLNVERLGWA